MIRLWTKAGLNEAQRLVAAGELKLTEEEEQAVARNAERQLRLEQERKEVCKEVEVIIGDWQQRWMQGDVEHFQQTTDSSRVIHGSKMDLQYQYLGRNVHAFNKVGGTERVQKKLTPPKSHRIVGDVFDKLIKVSSDRKFEVIMVDPPIRMGGADPVRGVALKYPGLSEKRYLEKFSEMVQKQNQWTDDHVIFHWVTNGLSGPLVCKMNELGYTLRETITWVKKEPGQKSARTSPGYLLNHVTELCQVYTKAKYPQGMVLRYKPANLIEALPTDQSAKPTEIYAYIERLFPQEQKLELFARFGNLRSNWTSVGYFEDQIE